MTHVPERSLIVIPGGAAIVVFASDVVGVEVEISRFVLCGLVR